MREEEYQSTSMSPQTQNPSKTESFSHITAFYEVVGPNFLVFFRITWNHVKKQTGKGTGGTGISTSATGDLLKPFQTSGSQVSWGIVLPIFFRPSIGQNTKKMIHAHVENFIIHN